MSQEDEDEQAARRDAHGAITQEDIDAKADKSYVDSQDAALNAAIQEVSNQVDALPPGLSGGSGHYTPTITADVNLDAVSAPGDFNYIRIGNVVHVAGALSINPTANGFIQCHFDLPYSSAFGAPTDVGGVAASDTATGVLRVQNDAGLADAVLVTGAVTHTFAKTYNFTFTYLIR